MRWIRVPVVGMALSVVYALAAPGRSGADVSIYEGQPLQGSGVSAKSWGSGTVKESEEAIYKGVRALKVSTQGAYQGLRIVLAKPADLTADLQDRETYLEIVVKLQDSGSGGSGGSAGPGSMGMGGMPGMPGGAKGGRTGGLKGGTGGPGGPGAAGGMNQGYDAGVVAAKPLANVRAVLVTADGKQCEARIPLNTASPARDGWVSLAVPLSAVKGLASTSAALSEVRVFGDTTTTFTVGRVRTVAEQTPLRVLPLEDRTAAVNDLLSFTAEAETGVSPVRYEWSVVRPGDPASGDLPVDAEGRTFKHKFRKGGDYQIVLTVRDPFGIKQPVSARAKIHVTL